MEYLIILLVVLVVLGYAFRIDQWDMWKTIEWETIEHFEAKGRYGNVFQTTEINVITKLQVSTNLKEQKMRCRVNYGSGWKDYDLDRLFVEIPDIRESMIKHGYKI